jgi:competence protein ComEC
MKRRSYIALLVVLIVLIGSGLLSACNNNGGSNTSFSASPASVLDVTTSAPQITESPAQESKVAAISTSVAELSADSTFTVHYIDVGQADSALILCDGKAMLIDGGNVEDSNLIYSYLKKLNIDHLDYMVCTHAHEDHVGGLAGALNNATDDEAYCPVTSYVSEAFSNYVKSLDKRGTSITVPRPGDDVSLGSAAVTVRGPRNSADAPNNTSIVLRIVYGDTSFLFTGDAEREEEQDILNAGYALSSTVLKVGHHGSDTSTTYPFLYEVMPQYAVISAGSGNSYGHPDEGTLSRLRDAEAKVFRTDLQGDIICTSNGRTVSFTVNRNADADTLVAIGNNSTATIEPKEMENPNTEAPTGTDYVLNTNTKKFHYPWCSSVDQMNESNKQYYTGNREELINQGYSPCKNCNP